MIVLRELAPAKLNLYLHVTGKRPDGYHLLDSLVVFADIADKLEVTPADKIALSIVGPYADRIDAKDNSVLKAADVLRTHFKIKTGAALTLHKNLPVGAGLGGGSADAAAALKLLARFWKVKPAVQELHKLGLPLGADVPVCLHSTASYVSGIGEVVEPSPVVTGLYAVLVNTGEPLLTAAVFAQHGEAFSSAMRHPHSFDSPEACVQFLQKSKNDLQNTAVKLMPGIKEALGALGETKECALARMSGSGGTCFGLFTDQKTAQEAAQKLAEVHPEWWVKAATLR